MVIGGIRLRIDTDLRCGCVLPAAYNAFAKKCGVARPAGTLHVRVTGDFPGAVPGDDARVVATGLNDLGVSRLYFAGGIYTVGIIPCPGEEMRYMRFEPGFREATLFLAPSDRWSRFVLDSMLRIFFSQVAVLESAFLLHASAVTTPLGAHLFMGKSGTGKSTHSRLWLSVFDDCSLLNDDNPLVRLHPGGRVTLHGTPWSGKTPCWVERSAPLLSMTRLHRSARNRYTRLTDIDAFVAVLPGVSVINHSADLYSRACDTLTQVIGSVSTGILDCRPDGAAARVCRLNTETTGNMPSRPVKHNNK